MGLLSQLKSLLGLESEQKKTDGNDVEVTVERNPDAESEQAVKAPADEIEDEGGNESSADTEETEADETADSEGVAEGTEAAASTETLVDEDNADEPAAAAEAAEAAGPADGNDDLEPEPEDEPEDGDDDAADEDDSESVAEGTEAAASTETLVDEDNADEPDTAAEPAEAAGPAAGDDDDGEPVERLKGIGPAYAETLGEAGVNSIADLAAVEDVESLADETGLSEKRLGRWVDRAQSWEA